MHLNKDTPEKADGSPVESAVRKILPDLVSAPIFIAGVNRKLNLGNFENLDIFSAITIPMPMVDLSNIEELKEVARDTAALAFEIVARETGDRWRELKELQRQGRPPKETP